MSSELTRPIVGIANRSAQEVFDIMCDRIRALSSSKEPQTEGDAEQVRAALRWLYGMAPDAEGHWFGSEREGLEPLGERPRYWWRSVLDSLLPASFKVYERHNALPSSGGGHE